MHVTAPLEDSNYGIRSIDSSFSDDYDHDEEGGSDSSGGSTVHLDLSPSSSTLSPSSTPPPIQPTSTFDGLPIYGPLQEHQGTTTLLESLPRGAFLSPSHSPSSAPPPPRLPLLPLLSSSTSSPICLSPPLSPVNSYSSLSSSSPPEMNHYLSDSVSSLGSLENDLSASSTSAASSLRSRSRRPNDQEGGSNGNLVLPTLSLQQEEEEQREVGAVELELRKAEVEEAGNNKGGVLRIVVVAGKESERELLVERLALELGVMELGEKEAEDREGWVGRRGGRKATSTEEGDGSSVRTEVWLGSSGNDSASVESLLQHVRSRHLPLSQLLAPRSASEPPLLRARDVLELAATGKGRGERGWIDCCVVVVDQEDSPSSSLSAARVLSSFAPTLLVGLQSTATSTIGAELTSFLRHLELVSPTLVSLLTTTSSPQSKLLVLDRNSLLLPDETGSEGLPTPQPGNTDDPFSFPSSREDPDSPPSSSFSEGLQTLFSTEKGVAYLHRFAARGFMRSRATLVEPPSSTGLLPSSLASSITSDSDASASYPSRTPRTRTKPTLTPLDIEEPDPTSFDPLHLPSALSTLITSASLRSFTSFVLEGFAIIGLGMLSVVAQSVLLGVVGEVVRRLDLRGAFVARTRWGRC